ncbi:tyrosine-protein phosphatase non-receptor type 3 isoform X6 [Alligator sinensis]|uniref:protein-tyrosine-phosphatase n=1 Tax=Alligator sinensis TaxID=38654 RepID=A0A3Q0GZ41_ALLSI|nr:tyrosine-protein phosphatase non-receptor type 3 isoform X6 [Alligator sinensis]
MVEQEILQSCSYPPEKCYSEIVMNSRLRALGGRINNIRSSELPKEKTRSEIICNVHFLDGSIQSFKVNKQDTGQILLDMAYNHLGVTEKEYFGLQQNEEAVDSPRWLETSKPIKKQLKGGFPCTLHFRVRFFIPDPNTLQEEQTRHLFFLQLKTAILEGRLTCPLNSAVVLASYAVQAQLGDFNSTEHHSGYLSNFHFLPDQNKDFLIKVESLHEQHSGLKQSEAESCYINIARTLEFYGVELHSGRDLHNLDLMIGIASGGIAVYRKCICTSFYAWANILKISFKRKKFFIQQRQKHNETREHIVAFNMLNYRACKNLWKSCVEHHTFFQAKSLPHENKIFSHYWTLGSRNLTKSVNNQYCRKVIGGMVWNPSMRRSLSVEHLETKSLPSRSPPVTPNWRSPRLRHEIRKPRHSSVDNLTNEITYITETEDVFYTYKVSPTSKNSDSEVSQNRSPWRRSPEQESSKNILGNSPSESCLTHTSPNTSTQSPNGVGNTSGSYPLDGADQQFLETYDNVTKGSTSEDSSQYYCDRQLYRKKPGLSVTCAKVPQNMDKNRYKDVLPYDATRIILQGDEDYINANYVTMEIPSAGIVNRYIATQGPLPHTCAHFWQVVWDHRLTLIIMLTTLTERGRTKCHQYWPDPPEIMEYGNFRVKCQSEDCTIAYVFREMVLTNIETEQEHIVTHLQYVAWPDHGVPDDSTDFLEFVNCMRPKRVKNEPVLVHCSAGIGRTGVLVTMETALCLIERNQPVYPLDIVRKMRDQRAMMVQTSSQYKFVCEAILRVYKEGLVRPLDSS